MKNYKFDLDRLADPIGRGGGRTTSDLVTVLSNFEFSDSNRIVIWTPNKIIIDSHIKKAYDVAIKMGFDCVQTSPTSLDVEGKTILYCIAIGRTLFEPDDLFLSPVTKELCDKEFFLKYS